MFDRILPLDGSWPGIALNLCVQATLILAAAAVVTVVFQRTSAAFKHRVWALTFVALILLPAVNVVLPGWTWRIIPRDWQPASVAPPQVAANVTVASTAGDAVIAGPTRAVLLTATTTPSTSESDDRYATQQQMMPSSPSTDGELQTSADSLHITHNSPASSNWLQTIWMMGVALVLLPLAIGIAGNLCWRHRGKLLTDAAWQQLLNDLRGLMKIKRRVALIAGGPDQMPMTFGWINPFVVLPSEADGWPNDRQRMVLLHELAHVKRCDVAWQIIARLGCALYWFHPLVWYGIRRMRLEREHACDDCALMAGQKASNYASQLLHIARAHRTCSPLANAALSMARPSQLEGRLLAVFDAHRSRAPLSAVRSGGLLAAALLLVIGLGTMRPTAQADTPETTASKASTAIDDATFDPNTQQLITGTVMSPKGQPMAAATGEFVGYNLYPWHRNLPGEDDVEYQKSISDASGRFRFAISRNASKPPCSFSSVIVSAPGGLLGQTFGVEKTSAAAVDITVKLHESKAVRMQLVDSAGLAVSGIAPHICGCELEGDEYLSNEPERATVKISAWPKCGASDTQGFTSVELPAATKKINVGIEDDRLGTYLLRDLPVGEQPTMIVLKPARFLRGTVLAADTGAPIGGGYIAIMEPPYRLAPIGADGSFRVAHTNNLDTQLREGESIIQIYPPADSPYLFYAQEWTWPKETVNEASATFKLQRGIVVEGQIVEKGSGKPVPDARVYFEPQEHDNKFFRESARSRYGGAGMKYQTDEQGHFRLPVWPGPGYLFVKAPTLDYVHVMVSLGETHYGKPGLGREYYDGALRFDLASDEKPEPITIALDRGVTLRRKVVRPDGQPALGNAYSRSYLPRENNINNGQAQPIVIEDGRLELPGFEPEHSNPLFIIDLKNHCAATVSPTTAENDFSSPPIRLEPCGAAKFHVINDKGEPLVDYDPRPALIVTPGAPANHFIQPNQPLWDDDIIWQNIGFRYPSMPPKTDAQGTVIVPDLIPGATYWLHFVNKQGRWDQGYEFTVRAGETTDVGDVVIPSHD